MQMAQWRDRSVFVDSEKDFAIDKRHTIKGANRDKINTNHLETQNT